ncbi:MAG: single-stranded DNA-binding protein [bacterium]|nr:single-stranded DNA-binding protein [bacterium]
MLNQIILVGRLVREPELKSSENNKQYMIITLAIPRSFKNSSGEYDTDYVDCILWDTTARSTSQYCHKGDIVGIKGRIQSRVVEQENDSKKYYTDIIAERVTFLSSNKKSD